MCWRRASMTSVGGANESMASVMHAKGVPLRFDVWGDGALHDWPVWLRMVEHYL